MSFKGGNIPLSMIEQYKTHDPFKTYAGNVNNRMLVDSNAFTNRQKLDLQMRKAFAQADMSAYSQGKVGGKK
jgi:hypothetical protein